MEKNMKTKLKKTSNIYYTKHNIFESINNRFNTDNKCYTLVVPHVCNNVNSFGAGFAFHVQQHYPIVKENFHLLGNKSRLGYTQFVTTSFNQKTNSEIVFANMIAQNNTINKNNPRPLNYAALVRCMIEVKAFIDSYRSNNDNEIEIHAPKFGSGLAGGNWNFIENLIEDIWTNTNTYIHLLK